ncbi:hypothetical protein F53441_5008 [Fusarium austroafricanum]|uniref:Alcohol dehydrogenase iron-type/glycerol dehydrogenase GldA domain-containing protein n=1 Tax=Fusarium austroafricanum TaxID=2364996 RepID=A0A8H4KJ06_9HYPO|nr:hypothetical protein F53441_5008 [Fusarium austroafricanum]
MHISILSPVILGMAAHVAAGPCKPESSKSYDSSSITSGTTLDISSTASSVISSIETTYTVSDIKASSTTSLDSSSTEATVPLSATTYDIDATTVLPSSTTEETTTILPKETTPAELFRGGYATFYYQNGNPGECGVFNRDSDFIVALSYQKFDTSLCGRRVRVSTLERPGSPAQSVDVTVAGYSPTSMNENSLDLSEGAFKAIGKLSDGMSSFQPPLYHFMTLNMTDSSLQSYRIPQLEGGYRPGSEAIFNSHSKDDILSALKEWDSQRILLVHSKALARNTQVITDLKEALGDRLTTAKEGVGSHSPYEDVIDIAHRITENKIDCVISVGSGSYSDACKVARLMSATLPSGFKEKDMEALLDQEKGIAPQDKLKKAEGVKLILVPTSLSAGEWNHTASCTNSAGKKQHFSLLDGGAPDLILVDPWVARTAPEKLWLSSGIRAVDHCVETLCNPKCAKYPDVQEWCEKALRDLSKGLVEYREGLDRGESGEDELLHGVSKCQAGSRMALMGFIIYRVNMGASHAIGHQLGSVGKVMHGITSCIMLPAVLRYTKTRNPKAQEKIVKIFNETLGWDETEAGDCVAKLVGVTGLPSTLREVGVTSDEQIEQIIDKTMTDVMFSFGSVLTREEISAIVYSAK